MYLCVFFFSFFFKKGPPSFLPVHAAVLVLLSFHNLLLSPLLLIIIIFVTEIHEWCTCKKKHVQLLHDLVLALLVLHAGVVAVLVVLGVLPFDQPLVVRLVLRRQLVLGVAPLAQLQVVLVKLLLDIVR